ncbi:MAG: DUF6081 family protein [Methanomicrobiales archaeon]|nr:DUF6081 family protein [Methanomicrobiales archaeon]
MHIREDFSSGLFSIGSRGGRQPWFYHQQGAFLGRDPKAIVSITLKGLSVTIPHYSLTGRGAEDHIKFIFWRNDVEPETGAVGTRAPPQGALVYEVRGRAEPMGTAANPFDVSLEDYRLSCGAALSTDLTTHIGCHFLFTSTKAFVAYERNLLTGVEGGGGASFCYVIPVAEFGSGTEHTYRISYSREMNTASWSLDGKQVFATGDLGKRLGDEYDQFLAYSDPSTGTSTCTPPDHRICGAGLLTLLDAGKPKGEGLVDLDLPETPKGMKIFGQGGKLVISEIQIWTE